MSTIKNVGSAPLSPVRSAAAESGAPRAASQVAVTIISTRNDWGRSAARQLEKGLESTLSRHPDLRSNYRFIDVEDLQGTLAPHEHAAAMASATQAHADFATSAPAVQRQWLTEAFMAQRGVTSLPVTQVADRAAGGGEVARIVGVASPDRLAEVVGNVLAGASPGTVPAAPAPAKGWKPR